MAKSSALINVSLALAILVSSSFPSDQVLQDIEETGVRLGAFNGCYTSEEGILVCVLDNEEEKEDDKREVSADEAPR